MAGGNILVIRGGAIGDFILTLPVLSALRAAFPETRVEVLGYPHIARLALSGRLADEVRSIESQSLAPFFALKGDLSAELATYFASFDIIISYLYDPDQNFQENVARCSKAQFIAGRHRPNENNPVHATEVFLEPLTRLAIFDADPVPRLNLEVEPSRRSGLAVHPGSGSDAKNWPENNWAELLKRWTTRSTGKKLFLIGGEADGEKVNRLSACVPIERRELAQNLPLTDLAQRLSHSAFFAGHDSGITHLAAAVGLPGVVLWGHTNAAIWKPRTDGIKIIRSSEGLSNLSIDEVLRELPSAV